MVPITRISGLLKIEAGREGMRKVKDITPKVGREKILKDLLCFCFNTK